MQSSPQTLVQRRGGSCRVRARPSRSLRRELLGDPRGEGGTPGAPRGSSNGRRAFWTQQASLGPKLPSPGRFLEGISSWAGSRPGTQVYPSRGAAGARAQSAAGDTPRASAPLPDPRSVSARQRPGLQSFQDLRGSRGPRGLTVGGGGRARLRTRGSSGPGSLAPRDLCPAGRTRRRRPRPLSSAPATCARALNPLPAQPGGWGRWLPLRSEVWAAVL